MNLKSKILNLGHFLLRGITILGVILIALGIKAYSRSGNNWVFLIGIAMLIPMAIVRILEEFSNQETKSDTQLALEDFKKRADKVKINLENLEIASNSWSDTVVIDDSREAALDTFMGDGERHIKQVETSINFIEIPFQYRGKKSSYGLRIPYDTTKLKIHFALQKETSLYIDPQDADHIYLDLEFLT